MTNFVSSERICHFCRAAARIQELGDNSPRRTVKAPHGESRREIAQVPRSDGSRDHCTGLCASRRRIHPTKRCLVEEANTRQWTLPLIIAKSMRPSPLITPSDKIFRPFVGDQSPSRSDSERSSPWKILCGQMPKPCTVFSNVSIGHPSLLG